MSGEYETNDLFYSSRKTIFDRKVTKCQQKPQGIDFPYFEKNQKDAFQNQERLLQDDHLYKRVCPSVNSSVKGETKHKTKHTSVQTRVQFLINGNSWLNLNKTVFERRFRQTDRQTDRDTQRETDGDSENLKTENNVLERKTNFFETQTEKRTQENSKIDAGTRSSFVIFFPRK